METNNKCVCSWEIANFVVVIIICVLQNDIRKWTFATAFSIHFLRLFVFFPYFFCFVVVLFTYLFVLINTRFVRIINRFIRILKKREKKCWFIHAAHRIQGINILIHYFFSRTKWCHFLGWIHHRWFHHNKQCLSSIIIYICWVYF